MAKASQVASRFSRELSNLIIDIRQHREYMRSLPNQVFRVSGSPPRKKSALLNKSLGIAEKNMSNLIEAPRNFIPTPIIRSYFIAVGNSMRFIQSLPISAKHRDKKEELAIKMMGKTFNGFSYGVDPSYFMTGQFEFSVLESIKKYATPSLKFVEPKGFFRIGLRNFDYDFNISPYGAARNRTTPRYFALIGRHLQARGALISNPPVGRKANEVAPDEQFMGLTSEDVSKILSQTERYIRRYYRLSLGQKIFTTGPAL